MDKTHSAYNAPNVETKSAAKSALSAEEAMNIVLKAEREAQLNIKQCEMDAEAIMERARQTAHNIAQRTDNRITRIHQRCSRIASDEISHLNSEAKKQNAKLQAHAIETATTASVVQRIVESLVGSMRD